jgi:heme exporter protein D
MEPRIVIAYGIIALVGVAVIWFLIAKTRARVTRNAVRTQAREERKRQLAEAQKLSDSNR